MRITEFTNGAPSGEFAKILECLADMEIVLKNGQGTLLSGQPILSNEERVHLQAIYDERVACLEQKVRNELLTEFNTSTAKLDMYLYCTDRPEEYQCQDFMEYPQ